MSLPRSGLLNVNKSEGVTSRDVVNQVVRKLFPLVKVKVGHAGTLDPMATGVLVVAVGTSVTRLIPHLQEQRKTYRATFRLGAVSDTEDITGEVTETGKTVPTDAAMITQHLGEFIGEVQQRPPAYSALKVKGKRAYDLARQGKAVELAARPVRIYRIELVSYEAPELTLEIECGKGTYIRSLGRDLGERLGCGAVMSQLERTRVGPFSVEEGVDLESVPKGELRSHLQPALLAVESFPRYQCDEAECREISFGRSFVPRDGGPYSAEELTVLVTPEGELAALAKWEEQTGRLKLQQVFIQPK